MSSGEHCGDDDAHGHGHSHDGAEPADGAAHAARAPQARGDGAAHAERIVGKYRLGKQVGAGSFATVWRGAHVDTGEAVAVKQINLQRLSTKLQESLESEIAILQHTRHANIIKLHDIIKEPEHTYLVLELCTGGDLSQYIKRRKRLAEPEARKLAKQLCGGLRALRAACLVHRDLSA